MPSVFEFLKLRNERLILGTRRDNSTYIVYAARPSLAVVQQIQKKVISDIMQAGCKAHLKYTVPDAAVSVRARLG